MIVLGIDPGFGIVGYGVVHAVRNRIQPMCHGVITTRSEADFNDRLHEIYGDLKALIDRFKPDAAAVEKLFFASNQKTAIQVAEARGVILLALREKGVGIFEYTPLQVKMSITGYGKAEKKQVMEMTRVRLGLDCVPKPDDAADALAIALCHASAAESRLTGMKGKC